MTNLRTAAQLALKALEGGGDSWRLIGPAIDALKAALKQPEQEPYCYVYEYDSAFGLHREFYPGPYNGKQKPDRTVPVFTHPPRREWQSLSDKEISAMFPVHLRGDYKDLIPYSFARAIEAKLKELNHE